MKVSPLIEGWIEGVDLMAQPESGLKAASTEWTWADIGTAQHVAVHGTRVSRINLYLLQNDTM